MDTDRPAKDRRPRAILGALNVTSPPVPIEAVARHLGAEVRYEPFEGDLSGLLYVDGVRPIIGVNALHPKVRQRFTIAHELGHWVLHESERLHVDRAFRIYLRSARSSLAVDPVEIAANRFAADLLMPPDMIRQDVGDRIIDFVDDDEIRKLSSRYQVSLQAMIFRLINLGLLDSSL